jgi:hypothetical protein
MLVETIDKQIPTQTKKKLKKERKKSIPLVHFVLSDMLEFLWKKREILS